MNFRELVDTARRRGRALHLKPRTVAWAAKACGMSRQHLYNLMTGERHAPEWTVHRIARGLKLHAKDVQKALDATREEG